MNHTLKVAVGMFAVLCAGNLVTAKPKAKNFAGADGYLDAVEIAYYVISLHEVPISKLLKPGQTQLDSREIAESDFVLDYVQELRQKSGGVLKELPWRYQDIDNPPKLDGSSSRPAPAEEAPEIPGARKSNGPFKLRKNKDELTKSELSKVKGVSISYLADHNAGDADTLSSEGVLYYPFNWATGTGPSTMSLVVGPAVAWQVTDTDDAKTGVQDVTFSAATTYHIEPKSDRSALWNISGSPYFQTDLAGGHEIYGAEASVEFVGWLTRNANDLLFLGDYSPVRIISGLDYQLRLIPQVDYSVTEKTGEFSKRTKDDDWFRVGARSSFDLRLPAYKVEIGAFFAFLDALGGEGGYSDKYTLRASWSINDNVALALEKTKGETPVSDKEIDTTTLGLEAKF